MTRKLPLTAVLVLLLSGCAAVPPGPRDARDPLERFNRSMYRFNDVVDRGVARPVAVAYTKVTPRPVRKGISNFLSNFSYPVVIANDLLQAKGRQALRDTGRLVVNTTVGIGGLFDPASRWGLAANNEDFAQTLGRWGVPAGPYLMLPVLGPSTVTDTVGRIGDQFVEPRTYVTGPANRVLWGLNILDARAGLLETDQVIRRAFDPYVFVRNAYLQRRAFQIHDGQPPGQGTDDESVEIEVEDDLPTDAPADAPPAGTEPATPAGNPAAAPPR
jgi:phospholipid-binding lipoprotein MlaA